MDQINEPCRYPYDRNASWRVALIIVAIGVVGSGSIFVMYPGAKPGFALVFFGVFVFIAGLVYLYMLVTSKRVVTVDTTQRMVHLEHCVYPVRFFDVIPKRSVSIPFAEILSVANHSSKYFKVHHVRASMVYTRESRFVISEHFEGFEQLNDQLVSVAAATPKVSLKRRYELYAYAGAALVMAAALIIAFWFWL